MSQDTTQTPAENLQDGNKNLKLLDDVEIEINVILGQASMPIGQMLKLSRGAVIELNRKVGEPIDVMVNDKLIAKGEIILQENMVAVTLIEICGN